MNTSKTTTRHNNNGTTSACTTATAEHLADFNGDIIVRDGGPGTIVRRQYATGCVMQHGHNVAAAITGDLDAIDAERVARAACDLAIYARPEGVSCSWVRLADGTTDLCIEWAK